MLETVTWQADSRHLDEKKQGTKLMHAASMPRAAKSSK